MRSPFLIGWFAVERLVAALSSPGRGSDKLGAHHMLMNEYAVQPRASAPFLGQSLRILVAHTQGRSRPPFDHPKVTWIACNLDSACLRKAAAERPDLVLLEAHDAAETALQLCRSLRSEAETKSVRIAIWSPALEPLRRLEFYEAGADDVVTDVEIGSEAVMRLTADARRSFFDKSQIAFADLILFPERHLVWRRGKSISLSCFQLQLLQYLIEHPGIVFSRHELSQGLWNGRRVNAGSISTAMNRLRHLLSIPGAPDLIQTVRGIGYVLQAQ